MRASRAVETYGSHPSLYFRENGKSLRHGFKCNPSTKNETDLVKKANDTDEISVKLVGSVSSCVEGLRSQNKILNQLVEYSFLLGTVAFSFCKKRIAENPVGSIY